MTINNIKLVPNNQGGWLVIADTKRFGEGAILFESPKQSECVNYIRRTLVMCIRILCESKQYSEAETLINLLMKWLEEQKKEAIRNVCVKEMAIYSNGALPATVYLTEHGGMYIKAEQSPYGFTFYINKIGENVRKPRTDKVIKELASHHNIQYIGL